MANGTASQPGLSGGILTGGMARRFQTAGGVEVDKGLLDLHGKPLVAHAAQKLQPYCKAPVLISANRNQESYCRYGQVVADPTYLEDYQGPLAGLLAMLEAISTDWLMVLPVDSPFVPVELIDRLWQEHLEQPTKYAFYAQHTRDHPLCLLIHKKCAADLTAYLLAGQRRVQSWLAQQEAVAVDVRHYPAEAFFNLNEPADLQQAHDVLRNPSA